MNDYDKVFILGLDGLEYNSVEKWNLVHLKQHEYDKIKVPINQKTGYPLSPEVWASFLTGKNVHVAFESLQSPLKPVFKILEFMHRYTKLSFGLGRKIREAIPMKWWRTFNLGFPALRMQTFLDTTNSTEVNAPYYSNDGAIFTIFRNFGHGKLSLKDIIDLLGFTYKERKKQIFHAVMELENVDVVFAYTHFPDALQHFLFVRPDEIKDCYLDLDFYVSFLKTRIKESTLFLIVSDHGFNLETGMHSKYGFYSSNVPLNPKPKKITDFYNIIVGTPYEQSS